MPNECSLLNAGELLLQLEGALDDLSTRISQMEQESDQLRHAGMANAVPWLKDGKYLYLVYPTDATGHRRRVYIGSEQTKVEAAYLEMARYKRWDKLQTQLTVARNNHRMALQTISNLIYRLKSVQLPLWGDE